MPYLALLLAPLAGWLAYAGGARELTGRWPTRAPLLFWRGLLAALVALGLTALAVTSGLAEPLWLLALLTGLLVAIAWLDLETGLLADALTVALGVLAVTQLALHYGTNLAGWLPPLGVAAGLLALGWFFAGPYSRWRGRDMLGWGDVKFFAAAGLWLQPLQLPLFLIVAGGVGALAALAYKIKTGQAESPFAPSLCLALFACVAYQLSL